MPRLPNGKIDVKSLAEPEWGVVQASSDADSSSGGAAAAPSTDMEELLADIWAGELKVSTIMSNVGIIRSCQACAFY